MSKADLKAKLTILKNISCGRLKEPSNMPVAVYLREAEKLLKVGRRDLAELQTIGFSEERLDDLSVRIGALRRAESEQKMLLRHKKSGARHAWDELAAEGCRVRDNLLATLCFACRKERALVAVVRSAGEGRASHAMIQSLSNLAVLGREHSASLQAINYDLGQLDEVEALAERLGKLLGKLDHEKESLSGARLLRDAAFTHLQEGLKELREYGLYLFRENRVKKLDYTSDYLRHKRLKRQRLAGKRAVAPVVEGEKEDVWHRASAFTQTKEEERARVTGRRAPVKHEHGEENSRMQLENSTTALEICMNKLELCTETSGERTETSGERTETSGKRTKTLGKRTETSGKCTETSGKRTEGFEDRQDSIGVGTKVWESDMNNESGMSDAKRRILC